MNIENQELKLIKKVYGEKMMHLCREIFPTLLEKENLLFNLLEKNIAPTKSLSLDIIENKLEEKFKNYIYNFIESKDEKISSDKTPHELLKEKGYILYECQSEEEIQKFKKYYVQGEELCTFRLEKLKKWHIFFAVKENVEEIKRENFKKPNRQDLYGTSVISIQFSKGENNTLSIKNRYNHKVNNPDATFSNNLENIIPGLTDSFEKYYGLNVVYDTNEYSSFLTDKLNYVKGNDNKYYRYNYEINNIYYCENNIIIDNGNVIDKYNKEKERYILMDYFILDKKDKTIFIYDKKIKDGFINSINDVDDIKNIESTKDKIIIIKYKDEKQIFIKLDKHNKIISYKNSYVENIEDNFLYYNEELESIEIPNTQYIGNKCLNYNKKLKYLELLKVEYIGDEFLYYDEFLTSIKIPNVQYIGNAFLYCNEKLTSIEIPKVLKIGDYFIHNNEKISNILITLIQFIGNDFLFSNKELTRMEIPNAQIIGNRFLYNNKKLSYIEIKSAKYIDYSFLYNNKEMIYIELPNIEHIGYSFLYKNNNKNLCIVLSKKDKFVGVNNHNDNIKYIETFNKQKIKKM